MLFINTFSQQLNQITNNPAFDMRPVWTPDGNHLGFVSNRNSPQGSGWYGFSIWKIPADGGTAEKIEINKQSIHQFTWSPDGNSIVFYDGQYEPFWDIYIVPSDGGESVNLSNNQSANMAPKFSPDGTQIIFARDINGNHDIYSMLIDGTSLSQNTSDDADDNFPCYSPDGQKIAFASNRSGNFEIWIMNLELGTLTQLTTGLGNKYTPIWSPDGNYLAYIDDISGTFDIYIILESGGDAIQFTTHSSDDMYPSWSPDGSKIAFSSNRSGNDDVWTKEVNLVSVEEPKKKVNEFMVYPNPATSNVTIMYSLNSGCFLNVFIINSSGKIIKTLVNQYQSPGNKSVVWDRANTSGSQVPIGVYTVSILSKNQTISKKLIKSK